MSLETQYRTPVQGTRSASTKRIVQSLMTSKIINMFYNTKLGIFRTSGGKSSSRGQTGHQAAEDRPDIKQQWTGGTSSGRGQAGHHAVEHKRDIKQ